MHEDHSKEQYFFDAPTVAKLASFVRQYERPVLLCCPMVGRKLHEDGIDVPTLDLDERFSDLPGFVRYDVYRPSALPRGWVKPDLLLIDPPFFKVRPDQLFHAVRHLTGDWSTPLMVASNPTRAPAFVGTFTLFGLRPTGYRPTYVTVPNGVGIEFLGANIPQDKLAILTA